MKLIAHSDRSKEEQQEKQQKKNESNLLSECQVATQIEAKLGLISGTHAPVNRRPEYMLLLANALCEPYAQAPPNNLQK